MMKSRILVAFSTRYGSTREVAERVAIKLRESSQEVEVLPCRKVTSLEGFSGVVLGSALYIGHLYKEMSAFLERHRHALESLPPAFFALGPTGEGDRADVLTMLEGELARFPWLKPRSICLFGGKYDPSRLRFPDNLLAALPASPLHGMGESDRRDWSEVEAWALSLPELFARG
jgi:menaquinone-dependent protoporphyrinogen oxidase